MSNTERYTYRVTWSEEDEEHVGLCLEFPSLSWLDADQGAALNGITKLVTEVVEDMEKNGEGVPEPLSMLKFSGRFQTRIQPHVHRRLAMRAREEGRSLNSLVAALLAQG